jgi:TatA/E family protein of Tat protein translocase
MISGGEIFMILLAILLFFGANKIPEFARMMGKGVREFRKATEDIKREFNDSSSGVLNDIKSIRDDISGTLNKEIAEPVQDTVNNTATMLEETYKDPYSHDDYYDNKEYNNASGNEFAAALAEENTDTVSQPIQTTENDKG